MSVNSDVLDKAKIFSFVSKSSIDNNKVPRNKKIDKKFFEQNVDEIIK